MDLGSILSQAGGVGAIARQLGVDEATVENGAGALLPHVVNGVETQGLPGIAADAQTANAPADPQTEAASQETTTGGLGGMLGGLMGGGAGGGILGSLIGGGVGVDAGFDACGCLRSHAVLLRSLMKRAPARRMPSPLPHMYPVVRRR